MVLKVESCGCEREGGVMKIQRDEDEGRGRKSESLRLIVFLLVSSFIFNWIFCSESSVFV